MFNPVLEKMRNSVFRAINRHADESTGPNARLTASSPSRLCVYCRRQIESWRPYRTGLAGRSPFLARLETVGSNIERFSCPNCQSTDRERHLHLFFDRLNIWESIKDANVLHMAPEKHLGESVRNCKPSLYVGGDLFPTNDTIKKIDLEHIDFPDETFDLVICNHILEHVDNPKAALGEAHRVLRSGGRFVCQTPFASRLSAAFEDPLLQSESDRLFFYGQEDHLRLFGLDIENLIVAAGFIGRLAPHAELLPEIDPELLGVNEREPFFDFVRG